MRTDAEILVRIEKIQDKDFLRFQLADLAIRLPFDAARPLLKEDATAEKWGGPAPRDRETLLAEMKDYLPFAFGKANNCRGLSAQRSIDHYRAWTWLAGDDALCAEIEKEYEHYGKGHLVKVAEHYGWDWRALDNGEWVNEESATPITADEALGRQPAPSAR